MQRNLTSACCMLIIVLKLMVQTYFEYQRQRVTTLSVGYIEMSDTQEM